MSKLKRNSAAAALAVGLIGGFEGLRQNAYPDPATGGKPWTICYGHATGDVTRGEHKSIEECKALLVSDLDVYANGVEKCIHVEMPDKRFVATVSLAYNIGVGNFCKSSVAHLLNEGRTHEACDAFLRFNRAAGIVFPGLTRRREREREYCLAE